MLKRLFDRLTLSFADKHEIFEFYKKYHTDKIEPLAQDAYNEFRLSGKRVGYERLYFDRRRRIDSCFMMYKAYGKEFLPELQELLYAVCDEYTWALPAHTLNSENPREEIDLFSSETAQMLTEISYILSDTLDNDLQKRIYDEVTSRVISVFEDRTFGWENAEHNWSAVCGGCIGMVYLYRGKTPPKRIFNALNAYLSGINKDGVCLEGVGYWAYGFGYYMYFASLLKEMTGHDIMTGDKINALAHFGQNAYLGKNAVSCSDCTEEVSPSMGFYGVLNKYFKDIYLPQRTPARHDDCGRWADYLRSYLYPLPNVKKQNGELVYPVSQWYINKKEKFSFFIKGGNNAEPHNHNDIGSFIIANNDRQLICDIGCGEYTDKYFNDAARYDYLCTSSFGHNLPIIDGEGQSFGEEYHALSFVCKNGHAEIEIGTAYEKKINIRREIKIGEKSVILRDTFDKGHKILERFVTKIKPTVYKDKIIIENLIFSVPDRINETSYSNHFGINETVYLLDYVAQGHIFEIEFEIK